MVLPIVDAIPISKILRDPQLNIRDEIDHDHVGGLAASIAAIGLSNPIAVYRGTDDHYVMADGWHRCLAKESLGETMIAAAIYERPPTEQELLEQQYLLNAVRKNLNPLEQAHALKKVRELSGQPMTEIITRLGLTASEASKTLALLKLSSELQAEIASGRLPVDCGYYLSRVEDLNRRQKLAAAVLAGKMTRDELSQAVAAPNVPNAPAKKRQSTGRTVVALPGGRTLAITGGELTIGDMIESLVAFVGRARKAQKQGIGLAQFVRIVNAESATGGVV